MIVQLATAQSPNAATDRQINSRVRAFLKELNKDSSSFWTLPRLQEILTGLQNRARVDISGGTAVQRTISQNSLAAKLSVMTPRQAAGKPGVLFFLHGASGSSATSRTASDSCATWWTAGV